MSSATPIVKIEIVQGEGGVFYAYPSREDKPWGIMASRDGVPALLRIVAEGLEKIHEANSQQIPEFFSTEQR